MSGITVAPAPAPVPPPKPAPKTGVERIRELHKIRRDVVNEVTIEEECSVDDWAQFCVGLLKVTTFVSMKAISILTTFLLLG
jgi:hypothetical protein